VRLPRQFRLLHSHATGASFSWECAQHGDSFGGKFNDLQFPAGHHCSHRYGKTVLAVRASSPPAVQG